MRRPTFTQDNLVSIRLFTFECQCIAGYTNPLIQIVSLLFNELYRTFTQSEMNKQ